MPKVTLTVKASELLPGDTLSHGQSVKSVEPSFEGVLIVFGNIPAYCSTSTDQTFDIERTVRPERGELQELPAETYNVASYLELRANRGKDLSCFTLPGNYDMPWTTRDALARVVEFAEQKIRDGYDGHGWEELELAVAVSRAALTKAEGSTPEDGEQK